MHAAQASKALFLSAVAFHFLVYWCGLFYNQLFPFLGGADYQLWNDVVSNMSIDISSMYGVSRSFFYLPAFPLILYGILAVTSPVSSGLVMEVAMFGLVSLFFNIGTCFLVFNCWNLPKMQELVKFKAFRNPYNVIAIFMMLPVHYVEYHVGNVHAISCFFLVAGFFHLLQEKEREAILFTSISIIFKIITVYFLIYLLFTRKGFRNFIKLSLYASIPHVISLVMFLAYPGILAGFINQMVLGVGESFPQFNQPANMVDALALLFGSPLLPFILVTTLVVPINVHVLARYKKKFTPVDPFVIISLILMNTTPVLFLTHVEMYSVFILIWFGTRKTENEGLEKYVKWMVLLPVISVSSWFFITIYPVVFLVILFAFDYSFIRTRGFDLPGHDLSNQDGGR